MRLLEGKLKTLPEMFVKNMVFLWIEENVQVVEKLSRIDVWKQISHKKDRMCIVSEGVNNILSYVDFSKLCHVILMFSELSFEFVKNSITLYLSNSERAM